RRAPRAGAAARARSRERIRAGRGTPSGSGRCDPAQRWQRPLGRTMFKILTLNNISVAGLERLPRDRYEVASEIQHPDAILVRSANMHEMEIPPTLLAVARAGAGVNNIPVAKLTRMGIPVFNAPGGNANAVKELVIAGMLLGVRNIC